MNAGDGDDTVSGGDGGDNIGGGAGDDEIDGEMGNDTILGQDGDDDIFGGPGPGEDVLSGGAGDDNLDGGAGADLLEGGAGNDNLDGGAGADLLKGVSGDNTFTGITNGDTIVGGTSNDTIELTDHGDYSVTYDDPNDQTSGTVNFDGSGDSFKFSGIDVNNIVPCFTPGTRIATPRGECAVEDLRIGDRVLTRDNGLQEIRWIGQRALTGRELLRAPHLRPVLIRAGALGGGLPLHDMLVSPQHRMLLTSERAALYFEEREVLAAAKHLTDLDGIDLAAAGGTTYVHFMCDQHEVVLSNGAWSESFQPGEQVLDGMGASQRDEIFELFPELRDAQGVNAYQAARRSLKKHEARLLVA